MDYRSIVLRLLILYVFINGTNVLAQTQVIVGDTDKVAEQDFGDFYSNCKVAGINYRGPYFSSRPFDVYYDNKGWRVYYNCKETGLVKDTTLLELFFDYSYSCRYYHDFLRIETSAIGISDSLVLIRPRDWTVDLYFDTISKRWTGATTPILRNNINQQTTFSKWSLKNTPDSLIHLDVYASLDSGAFPAVTLRNFEKYSTSINFTSTFGSSYNDVLIRDTLLTKVHNVDHDSVYQNFITFILHAVPYKATLAINNKEIDFDGQIGKAHSKFGVLRPSLRPVSIAIDSPRYPFSIVFFNHTKVGQGAIDSIQVICSPKTSGHYSDIMSIRYGFVDWLGNIHYEKQVINLAATITSPVEEAAWEPTAIIPEGVLYQLTKGPDGNIYEATQKGILRTTDEGLTWQRISEKEVPQFSVNSVSRFDSSSHVMKKILIMLGISNSKIVRSLDTGKTWANCSTTGYSIWATSYPGSSGYTEAVPTSIVCNSSGSLYSTGFVYNRVYRNPYDYDVEIITATFESRDLGRSWQRFDSATIPYTVIPAPTSKGYMKANNDEQAWCRLQDTTLAPYVASKGFGNGIICLGTTGGIFTYNSANTATQFHGLANAVINAIATDSNGVIYLATNSAGIFRSTDNGETWDGFNEGLKTKTWTGITIGPNNRVYIYSPYSGIYRLKDPAPSSVKKERSSRPEKEYEVDLYPNPASNMVSVAVNHRNLFSSIPLNKLQIVDVLGNVKWERYLSISEEKGSENLVTNIDLRSYRPGLYFVRLISPNSVKTQKLLIERSR